MLRAVIAGAMLFVATALVYGQTVRDTAGPLETTATASSPENPIPRRLTAPPPARVQEWPSAGRGALRLQVTLDTTGRVAEIRKIAEPLVQIANGVVISESTRLAIAAAIVKSAATAVSQWTYEPPRAPITFPVVFTFYSNADPVAVQDPTPGTRGGGPSLTPLPSGQQLQSSGDFAAAAGAVRIGGPVRPPMQTKKVNPVYPLAAQLERVAGIVILEVIIDVDGKVREGRVLRSAAFLDEAAIAAVRQWEYTPTELEGKPVPVVMTVTVSFNMDVGIPEPTFAPTPWPAAVGAVRAGLGGTVNIPRQTKNASPGFPSNARSRRPNGGAVLLEILIGANGKVTDARVIRSSPLFDNEALKTARKWEFEPTLVNGVPTPVVVPATVVISAR